MEFVLGLKSARVILDLLVCSARLHCVPLGVEMACVPGQARARATLAGLVAAVILSCAQQAVRTGETAIMACASVHQVCGFTLSRRVTWD